MRTSIESYESKSHQLSMHLYSCESPQMTRVVGDNFRFEFSIVEATNTTIGFHGCKERAGEQLSLGGGSCKIL